MILDLSAAPGNQEDAAEICIVGGGIAGLISAHRLACNGHSVIVLESGGAQDDFANHPLNDIQSEGDPYLGATLGRARALGGTSSRWGGALIPFLPEDLEDRPHLDAPAWPVRFTELAPYVERAERLFGLDQSLYDWDEDAAKNPRQRFSAPGNQDFITRSAKWPAFSKRNIAQLLARPIRQLQNLRLWLNATAHTIVPDNASGVVAKIQAKSLSGRTISVRADQFVFASGAIESTRLLLLLDRSTGGSASRMSPHLGKGFHDHISLAAATIHPSNPRALNRLAGFRFKNHSMRSLRFELSPYAQRRECAPSSFGHISATATKLSGFDALRDVFRSLQRSGQVKLRTLLSATADTPYLLGAAWWRYVEGRLLWPSPAEYTLHIVTEQLPVANNCITLGSASDPLGVPKPLLRWQVSPSDIASIQTHARCFDRYWRSQRLNGLGDLEWRIPLHDTIDHLPEQTSDIYHPGGTTRMGSHSSVAVVDRDLRAFFAPNVFVLSTSSFPTGASANPTLMLIAFAERLADHLSQLRAR